MRARLVLLDADVVIEAMRVGAWDKLIEQVEVGMTPTVRDQVTHEAHTPLHNITILSP